MRRLPLLPILALAGLLAFASSAGAIQKRVVNGDDAAPGQYPWTVALMPAGGSPLEAFCGGTLIAPRVVVTAAHCIVGEADGEHVRPTEVEVLYGQTDLAALPEADASRHSVEAIKLHPEARITASETRFDVALLVLSGDVVPAGSPSIIALATAAPAVGDLLKVTGWGRDETGSLTDKMQEAEVERRDDTACSTVWGSAFGATDQFCALRVQGSTVIDTCQGDSGGPITTIPAGTPDPTDGSAWRLVGAVSYGSESCLEADAPGVYARLFAPDLNAFPAEQIDGDAGNDPVEMAWWKGGTPKLDVASTPYVGDTVACTTGAVDFEPDSADVTLTLRRGTTVVRTGGAGGIAYTLTSADVGGRMVCEARARTADGGRYGTLRAAPASAEVVNRPGTTPTPAPAPAVEAPAPPPVVVVPPGPVPVPRDASAPRVSGLTRSCTKARRCTLRLRIADPLPSSGLRTPKVTLTTAYRTTCRRDGRARRCTKRVKRTLRARRSGATTTYLVRTGVLRKGRHTVRVTVADLAGNARRIPFQASFSLR